MTVPISRRPVILAFLQNAWHPPGTLSRIISRYAADPRFRRRLLRSGMSGRRLAVAFGDELFSQIIWDNASLETTDHASGLKKHSLCHMIASIQAHSPELVLAFGREAQMGMEEIRFMKRYQGALLFCHHPNARHRTQEDLNKFADLVRQVISGESGRLWGQEGES